MGLTKSESFTVGQNKRALLFKALGHPARVAILEVLLQRQSCICNDLVLALPLSQSTISQHLKALKDAGIIKGEIEGASSCYCINEEVWQACFADMSEWFGSYKNPNSCC